MNLAHNLVYNKCKSFDIRSSPALSYISFDQVYQKLSIFLVLAQAKPCASKQALEFLLILVALSV
jgi:hypothetical protein